MWKWPRYCDFEKCLHFKWIRSLSESVLGMLFVYLACNQGNILNIAFKDETQHLCWLLEFLVMLGISLKMRLLLVLISECSGVLWEVWECREINLGAEAEPCGSQTDTQTDRVCLSSFYLSQFSFGAVLGHGCSAVLLRAFCQFVWCRQGVISPWIAFGFIAAISGEHRGGSSCATRLFHIQGERIHAFLFQF